MKTGQIKKKKIWRTDYFIFFPGTSQKWKSECEEMNKVLNDAQASAHKMTVHDDPDVKHTGMVNRWKVQRCNAQALAKCTQPPTVRYAKWKLSRDMHSTRCITRLLHI